MPRICIAVLAALMLGAGCSGDDHNQPAASDATSTTEHEQAEALPSREQTTTTTIKSVWSQRALAAWEELDALLQRIGEKLDSYTWKEAKADLRAATRAAVDLIGDIAAAGPPGAIIKSELLELGRAVVDFGRELASASDCDRSETCVQAREFVRNHIYRLRQLWAEATTAPR